MDIDLDDVRSEQASMEQAYLEYRKACYLIVYKHARERGLIDLLTQPMALDDIAAALRVLPQRRTALSLLLKAMVRFGAIREHGGTGAFARNADFDPAGIVLDRDLIARAIGHDKVDGLIHSQSYRGIIDTFTQEDNSVASDFVARNLALWDEFLQQPFYTFGRRLAVHAVAAPGARILDIACGPGYGLLELAETVGPAGEVVGAEFSHDFLAEAVKRVAGRPNVRCLQADADGGLAFLQAGHFDGAMLIGAFHFLKRKDQIFRTAARVLRRGGRLCIGYAYLTRGSPDQELMDLRLMLREPPAAPSDRSWIERTAGEAGLALVSDAGSIGCFGWFLFEKQRP